MASDAPRNAPFDAAARRRAVEDFETNLVVKAGAGTGKTSLLVERALNAVGSGIAPVAGIAAITFTEKAAGELRDRLSVGLDRLRALARAEVDPGAEDDARRAWRHLASRRIEPERVAARCLAALLDLDRAAVRTIHAFAADLLREFPFEAGVDPGFTVDAGEGEASALDAAWDAFVAEELGPRGTRGELWRTLLARAPLADVEQVARGLAGFDVAPALLDAARPSPRAAELLAPDALRLAAEIDALLAGEPGLTEKTRLYFEGARAALSALATAGLAAFHAALACHPEFVARNESGNVPRPTKSISAASADTLGRLASAVRRYYRDLEAIDEDLARLLVEAAAPFARRQREDYLRSGQISFDGLLVLARDLLRDHPGVRRQLKERYRLLLVDEFQDTDPVQYEIVLLLAEVTGESAADPFQARLAPGRLFVVGDAKQSVYRFRGADHAAHRRAVERIVAGGGAALDLQANFRSRPGVLAPVNRLFETGRLWRASDYQPDYAPIHAARAERQARPSVDARAPLPLFPDPPPAAPAVELWTVDLDGPARAGQRREAEGRIVAAEIERQVRAGAPYHHFTLLLRALTQVTPYLRALRERAIPFVVDGGRDFLRRPEVAQLIALLRALARPSDEPALLAFLRSPAGGASDVELAAWAAAGGRWSFHAEPDAARFPALARAFALLAALERDSRDLPADATVHLALARSGMLPLGAAAFEGAQRVANLQQLAAAAADLARDGRLSLEEVVEAIEEGRREEIKTDRPLADDAADAVRITSIHRMKGLENEVVILPDLSREARVPRKAKAVRVATLPDGSTALALAAAGKSNAAACWLDRENERHEEAEEARVFYVALTRARERLILLGGRPRGDVRWIDALTNWGYTPDDPPADGALLDGGRVLHRRFPAPTRLLTHPAPTETPTAAELIQTYETAVAAFNARARRPLEAPSALEPEAEAGGGATFPPRPGGHDRALGKAAGIVIHRVLERCTTSAGGTRTPGRAAKRDALGDLGADLARLCAETARDTAVSPQALLEDATQILTAFSATPLAAHLAQLVPLARELPILLPTPDGPVFRGTIDLVYREGDDLVVADYKTDRGGSDDDLRRRYGAQLGVYARAVREALGLKRGPRAELWMLRDGRRVEVG